jgi:hypothetical protein
LAGIGASWARDASIADDTARLREAEKVFADEGGDQIYALFYEGLEEEIVHRVAEWSGMNGADVRGAVTNLILPDVRQSFNLRSLDIRALAKDFSLYELQQLDAFWTSPIGQRWRAVRRDMANDSFAWQHEWRTRVWPAIFARHMQQLADAGITHKGAAK